MNTIIKTGLLAAAIGLMAPVAAYAQEESSNPLPGSFTGNIAIVNDYVFRGYTQTSEEAAVQGGLDWDSGIGLYAGTWASSLNFNDGNQATTEFDLYAGYRGTIDSFSYDLGFMYYWYPGASGALNYDNWEFYGKAGYDFGPAALGLGVYWSPNGFGGIGDAIYFSSTVTVPIVDMLSVSGGVNYYSLKAPVADYTDWHAGVTLKVYDWFDIDARYYDTDVAGCNNVCDARFIVKISRVF